MSTATILITSCKGGVGKSTVSVNIAYSLASLGRKVLLIDCDFGLRCLDMMLGVENDVMYDFYDLVCERVSVENAMLVDKRSKNLFFIAAPFVNHPISAENFKRVISKIKQSVQLDYIILDSPGTLNMPYLLDSGVVDKAIIVASHQPISIRAAGKTGEWLCDKGIKNQRLLINSFDFGGTLNGTRPGINEIIDRSYLKLLGVVPYDDDIMLAAESGKLAFEVKGSDAAVAFNNSARRLDGETVPLLQGIHGCSSRRRIKKLFK